MTETADKKLLFSITSKDFIMQTFRAGGKGGQKQNKSNTGVRLIHPPSGARGEARDSRHQHQNKVQAFVRLVNSKEFQAWHKLECSRRNGIIKDVENKVDELMLEKYLKIETL